MEETTIQFENLKKLDIFETIRAIVVEKLEIELEKVTVLGILVVRKKVIFTTQIGLV